MQGQEPSQKRWRDFSWWGGWWGRSWRGWSSRSWRKSRRAGKEVSSLQKPSPKLLGPIFVFNKRFEPVFWLLFRLFWFELSTLARADFWISWFSRASYLSGSLIDTGRFSLSSYFALKREFVPVKQSIRVSLTMLIWSSYRYGAPLQIQRNLSPRQTGAIVAPKFLFQDQCNPGQCT